MSSTLTYKQDFPVAFAEQVQDPSASTEFYIDWLEDSAEFPVLSSAAAINDGSYTSGNWELLQRKDILEEEGLHVLVPAEEEEEWSKLNAIEKEELYSKIIEKNAQELQPKQYTITSPWSNIVKESHAVTDDEDENYVDEEDNLGAELIDTKKSQSRRASRLSNRRKIHDLKAVDIYVRGIYSVATQKGSQSNFVGSGDVIGRRDVITNYTLRSDKGNALAMCSQFSHNMKKRTFKYLGSSNKKISQSEISEYNVHSKIIDKSI